MIGKDDPGIDAEGCVGAHPGNRLEQDVSLRPQQIQPAVEQVYGKEEGSTRNPIAAMIRHARSNPSFGRGGIRSAFPPYAC
jgi:hypothetical protein